MNETNNFAEEKGAAYAAFVNAPAPAFNEAEEFEKNTAKAYNRTAGAMLIHYGVLNTVQVIVIIVFSVTYALQGTPPQELQTKLTGLFVLLTAAFVSYFIGNPTGMISGLALTGRLKGSSDIFSRPKVGGGIIVLGIFVTMALQNISGLLQQLVAAIIQSDGTRGTLLGQVGFSDNMTTNIILVLYMALLGPITEELLFRGMVLKNTTCSDVVFGAVLSSLMFGMFHANIMQMIIGFLLGIFFAYIDIAAGSIIPSLIFHITNNSIACLIMYLQYAAPDSVETISVIYMIASIVIGIAGLVFTIKKLGKPSAEAGDPYAPVFRAPEGYSKSYTWRLAAKCPCLWIFAVIYTVMIIISMLPQPQVDTSAILGEAETAQTAEADTDDAAACGAVDIMTVMIR